MELGLKGCAAAITGGSKGIGKAIARGFSAAGVNLVLRARGRDQLEKTADEIVKESGVQVLPSTADIAKAESLKSAAAVRKDRFDAIHIVVNNAGGPMRRMNRQINWLDRDWIDDVNLKMIGMPDLSLIELNSKLKTRSRASSSRFLRH